MDIAIETFKVLFCWSAIASICTYLHDMSFNIWFEKQSRSNQELVIDNYLRETPQQVNFLILLGTFLLAWPFFVLDHMLTFIFYRRSVWEGLIEEIRPGVEY